MKHNLHGDVSKEDLDLAEELLEMEEYFDTNGHKYESSLVSKAYVCIAYDWYTLGDDDKGLDLIKKANKNYPGYFDKKIAEHIDEDDMYRTVVINLTSNILGVAKSILDGGNK